MTVTKKLDVRRVGSSLVASFGQAHPPLIWRFDLDRNHSFTCALQGHDGEWELGVTSVKGEFHPVARFPQQEDAEEAFATVSKVLSRNRFAGLYWFLKAALIMGFIFFVVLFVLTAVVRYMQPQAGIVQGALPVPAPVASTPPVAPTPVITPSQPQNGVPLPADDVLKPPTP